MRTFYSMFILLGSLLLACNNRPNAPKQSNNQIGSIEIFDSAFNDIIVANATIELIAEGFDWSEGPVWVEEKKMLLFSDVPADKVYKWTEQHGLELYVTPSGYTGKQPRNGERGSNGLLIDAQGRLVLCQHGNRQVARMESPLDSPAPNYSTLTGTYNGRRYNSPNDAVFASNGDLYFTDPPYGLVSASDEDPEKEIPFNGVYKLQASGNVQLLVDSISRPNGIGLFPGEQQIIIANSDPSKPVWYQYDISNEGCKNGKIFYDASAVQAKSGLPDGLKVDSKGNVFATGPGGVFIFNKEGVLLGKIHLQEAAANVALSANEKILFITNDMYLLKVKMRD